MDQQLLFDDIKKGITFDDAALRLGVSIATVRNWIKTGYLDQISRGIVSVTSFENFRDNVAGDEKLTARANKSLKDSHDHDELSQDFLILLDTDKASGFELGLRYEEALSNSYKNKEGIYYTPTDITERFFQYLPDDCSKLSFCDPCCGSGNFISTAIKHGFAPENIYGYDIDPVAVEVTKKRILELTGYTTEKIICVDFLESTLKFDQMSFDVIFTNPPWGKKLSKKQKNEFAKVLMAGNSVDTSSLFFFACLNRLSNDGFLGFLLQDAFFNVSSYEEARKKAMCLQILSIIDFGKPFKGLLTKAKGIIIKNSRSNIENFVECIEQNIISKRLQRSFSTNPKFIFNNNTSQQEADTISYLYSLPHITLNQKAKWGLGIVTGNNKKFIINEPSNGYIPVYKGVDIKKEGLSEPTSYISSDLSLYQQVAPIDLYQASQKLIYKFISSKLVFFYDNKQRFILNSANLMIPDDDFPISPEQLSHILNSRVINWLFQKTFDTHKVLRSDIESLPIHTGYFSECTTFDEAEFATYLGLKELENGTFRIKKKENFKMY